MAGNGLFSRSCIGPSQHLDQTEYTKPLPWVGHYAAAASLFLGLLFFLDFLGVVRNRSNLFTRRWFQLNAATLTILAVATKMPVDLNTPMPDKFDQLSKLSGNVFICTSVANFSLSLADLDSSSLLSNVVALVIFVITVIANICIQMRTGVIYVFWFEHVAIMLLTVYLLVLLTWWALALPAIRKVLQDDFNSKYNKLIDENKNVGLGEEAYKRLEQLMKEYWRLALIHRSWLNWGPLSWIGLVFSWTTINIVNMLIVVWSSAMINSSQFCKDDSDYLGSTRVIFYSQATVIFFDFLSKIFYYMFIPINVWFGNKSLSGLAANYWNKEIDDLEDRFTLSDNTSIWRKMVHLLKSHFLRLSRASSTLRTAFKRFLFPLIVVTNSLVIAVYIVFRDRFRPKKRNAPSFLYLVVPFAVIAVRYCTIAKTFQTTQFVRRGNDLEALDEKEEGAGLLGTDNMLSRKRENDVDKGIKKGQKKKPTELEEFIQRTRVEHQGVDRVTRIFDSRVPSLFQDREQEPKNSWAMAIVTLFSIAMNIPYGSEEDKRLLRKAVGQGLKYVRFVERHLDSKRLTYNARKEVQSLWQQIQSGTKWYDQDLEPQIQIANDEIIFEDLARKGQEQLNIQSFQGTGKEIAWYNMYKIAKTIQIQYYGPSQRDVTIFDWISETISDAIIACLSNIPRAIYVQCINNSELSDKEENIKIAAFIHGQTRDLITSVEIPNNLEDDRRADIDEWIRLARRSQLS